CASGTAVRTVLFEKPTTKGDLDFGRPRYLWISRGCCTHRSVYRIQSKCLYAVRSGLSSEFLARRPNSSISEWNKAVYQAALRLLFRCRRCSLLHSRCFAYSAAILLDLGAGPRARTVAEAL